MRYRIMIVLTLYASCLSLSLPAPSGPAASARLLRAFRHNPAGAAVSSQPDPGQVSRYLQPGYVAPGSDETVIAGAAPSPAEIISEFRRTSNDGSGALFLSAMHPAEAMIRVGHNP